MPQVVDSSNLVQLATTGTVPDFKPPESAKSEPKGTEPATDAKPADAPKPGGEAKAPEAEAKADAGKDGQARDSEGKFVKADDATKGAAPSKAEDDDDLSTESEAIRKKVDRIIGKKHRRMREAEEFATDEGRRALTAERRAEAAEREIARLRGEKSDGPKPGEGESVDPEEPKSSDFKTVGEYTRALVKYEAKKAGERGQANAAQQRQQEQANAQIGSFVERQDAFRAATPDYDQVVGESELELHNAGMQYLVESEVGPQLAYHLAKHPDEVTRLRKLSPTRLLAELGKLETKLEKPGAAPSPAPSPSPPREVSKAPAPIAPLEAKTTPVQKDPSQMSLQELRAHRQQEAVAKAGR